MLIAVLAEEFFIKYSNQLIVLQVYVSCSGCMYWHFGGTQNLHFQGDFNLLHMNAEVDGKNEVYQLW